MAYTKTDWKNREVERPNTFTMTTNDDGTVTLTPAEGNIFSEGTPIVAENLLKIEDQLVIADTHMNNVTNPHAVTASQVGSYSKTETDNTFVTKTLLSTEVSNLDSKINENTTEITNLKATKYSALLYANTNQEYPIGWSRVYLPYHHYNIGGLSLYGGYSAQVPRTGYCYVSASISFTDTTQTNGFVVVDIVAGNHRYRIGGSHYNTNGNLTVSGSLVIKVNAGDYIQVESNSSEVYTVVGLSGETRSFLNVREL